jgi:Holliday junction resolvase RusA-like endonuclease
MSDQAPIWWNPDVFVFILQRLYLVYDEDMKAIYLVVKGEPASKANSRRLIWRGKSPAFIKSAKALSYADSFKLQAQPIEPLLEGELTVDMNIYYATQRPDLDESLILDLLQDVIYKNDRQVREKHIKHFVDRDNPRVEIWVRPRVKLTPTEER